MAFHVEISPRAFNDLDEISGYIKQQGSFEQAQEWFNGIIAAIRTLEDMPIAVRLRRNPKSLDRRCASCCTENVTASTRCSIRFKRKLARQARFRCFM